MSESQHWKAEAAHLRRMMDGAADALMAHDTQGRFVDVNRQACQSLGYSREELLRMSVPDVEVDFVAKEVAELWARMRFGESVTIEGRHRRKDGSTFPVEVRVCLLSEAPGEPQCRVMLALVRDVSERLEQESRLRRAQNSALEEREKAACDHVAELFGINQALSSSLEALAAQSPASPPELDAFLEHVAGEVRTQIGAASAQLFLLDETTRTLQLHAQSSHNQNAAFAAQALPLGDSLLWRRLLDTQIPLIIDFSGELLWPSTLAWHRKQGHTRAIYVALKDGHFMGLLALSFAGGTVSAEEVELARVFALQATLAIQLTRLGETAGREAARRAVLDERNRLARDIHDALAQNFTGIITHLEAVRVVLPPASKAGELVASARDLARQGLDEARRSVRALRPQRLEEENLLEALDTLLRETTRVLPLRTHLGIEGELRPLSPEIETNLLRIAQESLTNVLRHARAASVEITLCFGAREVELRVQDDGCGFTMGATPRGASGFGLESMSGRAASLGGHLNIESQAGHGTKIKAHVPYCNPQRSGETHE